MNPAPIRLSAPRKHTLEWLCTGAEIFPAMLDAIGAAQKSVRLETYIYSDDRLGREFLQALHAAAQRGVRVRVLVDAIGSWLLPGSFFEPLIAVGGEARVFNPLNFWRFGVRDHRKLLVCDDNVAFIGGFNISSEYDGDGVTSGWCDVGARIENVELVERLAASFDQLFLMADFHRKPLLRLRAFKRKRKEKSTEQLLLTHPGRGAGPFQIALHRDLQRARDVQIISAYFLPVLKLRRALQNAVRRGARVRLILAGKTDVAVAQMAARHYFRRLLKAGVEIYEYQPQILHAKLFICDDAVYTGSANLDIRSLKLNYELMLRLEDETIAAGARSFFERILQQCRRIEPGRWQKSRTFWERFKSRWAHFLLRHVDPYVALRQFHAMKD